MCIAVCCQHLLQKGDSGVAEPEPRHHKQLVMVIDQVMILIAKNLVKIKYLKIYWFLIVEVVMAGVYNSYHDYC